MKGFSFWIWSISFYWNGVWRGDVRGAPSHLHGQCLQPQGELTYSVLVGTGHSRYCSCKWGPDAAAPSVHLPASFSPTVYWIECFLLARSAVVPCMPAFVHLCWMGGDSRCGVACFLSDYLAIQWATSFSHEVWIPDLGGSLSSWFGSSFNALSYHWSILWALFTLLYLFLSCNA